MHTLAMDDMELRDLLSRVKAGELSPEEAVVALGVTEPTADAGAAQDAGTAQNAGEDADPGDFSNVRVIRLKATANRTKVIGDPSVRTVRVVGPHRLRVDGHRLVVENEMEDEPFGFGGEGGHIRITGLRSGRGARVGALRGHDTLEVRVNPSMPVDFDCDAGMIEVVGTASALTGRVNAANAVIDDFDGPITLSVNAGKLRARGRLDGGSSSIDVNVGKADVQLEPGSNVRIIRSATFGSAESDGDVVGTGAGTLRVTCSLGAVRVHSR